MLEEEKNLNPILLEVSTKLETERLLLRAPLQTGDGLIVNKAIRDSFNELQPWMPFVQKIPAVDETEVNLRKAHIKFLERESFRFLIFQKDTKEFVCVASIQAIQWNIPKGELGYWVNTEKGGRGYMAEAVQELSRYAVEELKFKRLEIRIESTNYKSRAIPEKTGFKLEGILRNDDLSADGERLTDTCIYSLTRNK
jgi:ribosomal-protein-serine acetyltransferase